VRGSYKPITDDRNDRSLQRQGRKTPGNVAVGRVVDRKRRRSVDLAFKIKEKSEKNRPKKLSPTTQSHNHSSKEDILR